MSAGGEIIFLEIGCMRPLHLVELYRKRKLVISYKGSISPLNDEIQFPEINLHTAGSKYVMATIPQFQKKGAVPNRALTVGIPRISWVLLTSGKFLKE